MDALVAATLGGVAATNELAVTPLEYLNLGA